MNLNRREFLQTLGALSGAAIVAHPGIKWLSDVPVTPSYPLGYLQLDGEWYRITSHLYKIVERLEPAAVPALALQMVRSWRIEVHSPDVVAGELLHKRNHLLPMAIGMPRHYPHERDYNADTKDGVWLFGKVRLLDVSDPVSNGGIAGFISMLGAGDLEQHWGDGEEVTIKQTEELASSWQVTWGEKAS